MAFDNEPQVVPEQPLPASDHFTPMFAESRDTVAVKFCEEPTVTFPEAGATITDIVIGSCEFDFLAGSMAQP